MFTSLKIAKKKAVSMLEDDYKLLYVWFMFDQTNGYSIFPVYDKCRDKRPTNADYYMGRTNIIKHVDHIFKKQN